MYMRPTRDLSIKCILQDGSIDCMGKTIYPHDQTLVNLSQMLQRMQETFLTWKNTSLIVRGGGSGTVRVGLPN